MNGSRNSGVEKGEWILLCCGEGLEVTRGDRFHLV